VWRQRAAQVCSSVAAAAIAQGAFDAYFDYQASRTLGARGSRARGFESSFEYGALATFVLDLRSERTATEDEIEVFSDRQLAKLTQFLAAHHSSHVICVVVSVPFLHVPDWLMHMGVNFASSDGDIADRWSHPKARRSRNRLLSVLREHQTSCPRQRLVIVGGDVHIGMVGKLDWGEGITPSYQLVSSAFSNAKAAPARALVKLANHRTPLTIAAEGVALEATFLDNRLPDGAKHEQSLRRLEHGYRRGGTSHGHGIDRSAATRGVLGGGPGGG
jgi:phosphodiesterase/alkaline phosphatase D-like protein